mgnify:CR=1 FL=1
MKNAFDNAWYFLKQYDPMQPTHMRSQVFPEMSSDTRMFSQFPGGMGAIRRRDVGKPFQTRPATTRTLLPHERRERILADRDQAMERANQFHQDRIDAMKVLPDPSASFSQGGPEFNPFQPVNISNFSLDDPRIRQFMVDDVSEENEEQSRQERLEQMAMDAVRQGSAGYYQNPADMDEQTRSLFDAEVRNRVGASEQSYALPMRTFQSEPYR